MNNIISLENERAKRSQHQLKLHVELEWIEPRIWRKVIVPETITLEVLHHVIQRAFDWKNTHLHEFDFAGTVYSRNDSESDSNLALSEKTALKTALGKLEYFTYLYDFSDQWLHILSIEGRQPQNLEKGAIAYCFEGANAAPPEDVGGVAGYEYFQSVMANPKHPEYRSMKRWFKGSFNPELFDLDQINHSLADVVL